MKHLFRHWRTSGAVIGSLLKKGSIAVLALLVVFLAGRIYESQRGPALHRWHTWSGNEMSAKRSTRRPLPSIWRGRRRFSPISSVR
jgi:hypothetical protein